MKISRRSVLHISGLAAAALALTGCSAAGSAALGGKLPGLLKEPDQKRGDRCFVGSCQRPWPSPRRPRANSLTRPSASCPSTTPTSSPAPSAAPTAARWPSWSTTSPTPTPECRPQRGIGSADLLIEAKVEGGITRLCAVFSDADGIPEVGPIRSGRDQFLQLLMPWNILYYHDGESIFCTQFVSVYGYSG